MKTFILTCHSEIESAKKLGYEDTTEYLNSSVENYKGDLVVRWGNGMQYNNKFGKPSEFPNVITNYKNIADNCNKRETSEKLSEVVLTPKLYTKNTPKGKLVVYRPTTHAGGKDFQVLKGPIKIDSNHYATEFIKSEREIRVWYCNGRTMCARRVTKNQKRLSEKFKCRSLWSYDIWKKTPKGLHKQVLKAAKHLGFQYGAFDIIIGKNNKHYFLENNTAPSLDHSRVIKFYQRGLKSIINKKTKQLHKEWKKNPPLDMEFKVASFETNNKTLKPTEVFKLGTSKPIDKPNLLGNIVTSKRGFFSSLFSKSLSISSFPAS